MDYFEQIQCNLSQSIKQVFENSFYKENYMPLIFTFLVNKFVRAGKVFKIILYIKIKKNYHMTLKS